MSRPAKMLQVPALEAETGRNVLLTVAGDTGVLWAYFVASGPLKQMAILGLGHAKPRGGKAGGSHELPFRT